MVIASRRNGWEQKKLIFYVLSRRPFVSPVFVTEYSYKSYLKRKEIAHIYVYVYVYVYVRMCARACVFISFNGILVCYDPIKSMLVQPSATAKRFAQSSL